MDAKEVMCSELLLIGEDASPTIPHEGLLLWPCFRLDRPRRLCFAQARLEEGGFAQGFPFSATVQRPFRFWHHFEVAAQFIQGSIHAERQRTLAVYRLLHEDLDVSSVRVLAVRRCQKIVPPVRGQSVAPRPPVCSPTPLGSAATSELLESLRELIPQRGAPPSVGITGDEPAPIITSESEDDLDSEDEDNVVGKDRS
jgi:hypothetical protein